MAKAARISSHQVQLIEKIQKQGAPELVNAVKAGMVSLNAAAAVASLPVQEQVSVTAAGAEELKQAAKRVREAKRKPAAPESTSEPTAEPTLEALQARVAVLEAENAELRAALAALRAASP